MSFWAHAMGTAKSTIDREKGLIILRSSAYPKKGYVESVISGDTIVRNELKRKGVVTETIQISGISELVLDLGRIDGYFSVRGNIPKLWSRGLYFNAPDMFVAYEAYMYILSKRIDDVQNPIKHKISPVLVGLKQNLDNGVLNKDELRAKGVHF